MPIPKGTMLDGSWVSAFYNPDIFENPHDFLPERWEREDYKEKKQIVSLMFSAGPRSCIGKSLALIEIKVMVIKLIREGG